MSEEKAARLKSILKELNLTSAVIALNTGYSGPSAIDAMRAGRVDISGPVEDYLADKHNVNLNWLRTGKGERFINSTQTQLEQDALYTAVIESNNRLNTMVDYLLLQVKLLGGTVPPSVGKLNGTVLAAVSNKLGKLVYMDTNTDTNVPNEVQAA